MDSKMPPLHASDHPDFVGGWLWTKIEMQAIRAYGDACRRLALEEAEKACDDVDEPAWYGYECPNTFQDGTNKCARAIRALARSQDRGESTT